MKRRIEQLINGRFEYEVPGLLLSREDIRESTKAGENIRGELIIAAENGSRIKGIAYSSHRRFLLGKERFTGEKIEIPYGADVKGLNPGDSFEGELVLSTSIGEYRVPFAIQVEPCRIKTSAGSIRDLDAFAELAKKDFKEAYHLFLDDSFPELLKEEQELWEILIRGEEQSAGIWVRLGEKMICACDKVSLLAYTTEEAGGFVGCTIGMYASSHGTDSKNYADYVSFTCSGAEE